MDRIIRLKEKRTTINTQQSLTVRILTQIKPSQSQNSVFLKRKLQLVIIWLFERQVMSQNINLFN